MVWATDPVADVTLAAFMLLVCVGLGYCVTALDQAMQAPARQERAAWRQSHENVAIARAQASVVQQPQTLHYTHSPVYTITYPPPPAQVTERPVSVPPGLPAPEPLAFAPPTLGAAITAGLFEDGRYLLGYGMDGRPIRLDAVKGRSLLIAGQGGAGGSTALTSAALQEILLPPEVLHMHEPARLILIDSHAHKPESLTNRLRGLGDRVLIAARTPPEVTRALAEFNRLCKARLDHPPVGGCYPFSLALIVDEANDIYGDDPDYEEQRDPLTATFLAANTQYRGIGGKAIARFQMIPARMMGGEVQIRRSFRSRAAYQLDPGDGVLLGLAPGQARQCLGLDTGHCFVMGPGLAPTRAIAPNVAPGDVATALYVAGVPTRSTARYMPPPMEVLPAFLRMEAAPPVSAATNAVAAASPAPGPHRGAPDAVALEAVLGWIAARRTNAVAAASPKPGDTHPQERAAAWYLVAQGVSATEIYKVIWGADGGDRSKKAAERLRGWLAEWVADGWRDGA